MIKKIVIILILLLMVGCTDKENVNEVTYKQISQDEAMEMMKKDDGHIIVDVRTEEEYAEGHIPEAVCIPNERIEYLMDSKLPDKDQIILVYCRSGNRSKQASEKLAKAGYKNVYEFGGINTWKGEIVVDGQTETVEQVKVEINGTVLSIAMMANSSAEAFVEKLREGDLVVEMEDYGNFEKVGNLPWSLVTNDSSITTAPGDVILYQGNKITIYYDTNTWSFTRLGTIEFVSGQYLKELMGSGNITARFFVE